jgi:hypothetical protein
MTRYTLLATAVAILSSPGLSSAQTKLECHIDESGRPTAALIWQNTLGAQRANEICQNSVTSMTQRAPQPPVGQRATADRIPMPAPTTTTAVSAAATSMQPAAMATTSATARPASGLTTGFTSDDYIAMW